MNVYERIQEHLKRVLREDFATRRRGRAIRLEVYERPLPRKLNLTSQLQAVRSRLVMSAAPRPVARPHAPFVAEPPSRAHVCHLSQWTKTLSFPARLSPNRSSKESVVNVQPGSPGVSPTPSASSLPQPADKTVSPIPITEISQIVSNFDCCFLGACDAEGGFWHPLLFEFAMDCFF
ncbi:hypothetical protein EVAR_54147_1 [Eumeta japonica]|uniref:Uncharacterized protein n=1 Tax=Eumeta variegata TaxID=151549 RepID=A0A4C1Y3R1_EUMVA|nr:hypothetical protein EVAR_54147_1 [Eumeta japonica]